jgi:hypothetical protein
MRKFILLLTPLALAAALVAGCGGGGGKKSVTVGDTKFETGSLPSGFPKDFPIYSGASFKGAISSTQQGEKGFAATWETGDSIDKVKSYYSDQFGGKSNWAQDSATDTGAGAFFTVHKKGDTKAAFLTIATQDGKTAIVVFVGESTGDSGGSAAAPEKATATTSSGTSKATPEATTKSDTPGATNTPDASPLPPEAKLPKDFPSDRVPLPSGARVTTATSFSNGGISTFVIEFYVKDTPEHVADFLKAEFAKHAWTDAVTSTAGTNFFLSFTGENGTDGATVSIEESDTTPGYAHAALSVAITQ